jgi:tetratricopeptide (TPR) repeat protein
MVTNLVVFENGELKREPVEVTYRTLTYYFDDSIAKIVEDPKARPAGAVATQPPTAPPIPAAGGELRDQAVLDPSLSSVTTSIAPGGDSPPPLLKRAEPEGVASAYSARKGNESASENVTAPVVALAETAPPSAQVQLSLGHEYLKAQKDREAIKAFKESIKLNPALAEAHYGLGYSSFRLGRFRDAADAFKKAIALEPKMAKAHYGLSLAYQELGMTSQLMEEYRILETLDRSLAKKLAQTFPQFNFSCRLVRGCP